MAVREFFGGSPVFFIAGPADEVLEFIPDFSDVENSFDFPLFFTVDRDRRWGFLVLSWNLGLGTWFEPGDIVEIGYLGLLEVSWKFYLDDMLGDYFFDCCGTPPSRLEFLGRLRRGELF